MLVFEVKFLGFGDWYVEGEGRKCLRVIWWFLVLEVEWMWMLVIRVDYKGRGVGLVKLEGELGESEFFFEYVVWGFCKNILLEMWDGDLGR